MQHEGYSSMRHNLCEATVDKENQPLMTKMLLILAVISFYLAIAIVCFYGAIRRRQRQR